MATRTIVTSQPDVACDVCERRLLRGEQPDTFIAAGRRLTVCELCAPQAAHEGWTRESDLGSLALPPARPRRGRSFIERLRGLSRPPAGREVVQPAPAAFDSALEPAPVDGGGDWLDAGSATPAQAPEALEPTWAQLAVEAFNASEFPRRIAGVARSLGAPEVSVASAEHLDSVVRIVVAWELSWYRYEVDLSEGAAEARLIAQGTELSELARGERLANAQADEAGALTLVAR